MTETMYQARFYRDGLQVVEYHVAPRPDWPGKPSAVAVSEKGSRYSIIYSRRSLKKDGFAKTPEAAIALLEQAIAQYKRKRGMS